MSNIKTKQIDFWQGEFGKKYTKRNTYGPKQLDLLYKKIYGISCYEMNNSFLSKFNKNLKILEIGCNNGQQLRHLQLMGFKNLFGIEIQWYATEIAKKVTRNINIIQGSAFDIPFRDGYFDLVFTAGVLIHINPKDIEKAMQEIYRVSKKYIWGFEYYSQNGYEEIVYRGNRNVLWKTDFRAFYQKVFPQLKLIKETLYPYADDKGLIDQRFLLSK